MKIIYISGIDGCGKTTQSLLLEKELQLKGISSKYAWLRWDPIFRKLFDFLKLIINKKKTTVNMSVTCKEQIQHKKWVLIKTKILSNCVFRLLWWEYACVDYRSSLKKQIKKFATSDVLIVDRYVHDFVIDQAINLGMSPQDQSILIKRLKAKGFRFPDFNIIINLPAEEGYHRKLDGTPLDYLKERELRYRMIPINDHTLHLNGMKQIDELAHSILTWVTNAIKKY